ncbi:MAG: NADH-quinone oxidoreductase subunit L [Chloroherpetonaceae bacterium]|nr:NADH-quinone oxidoreductase subunit L [Chloroherpetonaceae bacterium]
MDSLIPYAIIVLLLPLISFVIQIFFGKHLPRKGDFLATAFLGVTLAISAFIAMSVLSEFNSSYFQKWEFTWVRFGQTPIGPLVIKMGILIDNITAIMLLVVSGISFLVHLFSIGYMAGEVRYERFFGYLGLFTFSMLGIVLVDNLFAIYIFWELVGVSSYLLIGFYFEKESAAQAQKKAFMLNRVGDIGMWLGILILYSQFYTFSYSEITQALAEGKWSLSYGWLTAAGLLLFMGCVGKSAQFPLHTWLPDAMEGPTPVSALIHAATMVAAGVYFVARIFAFLTPDALQFIAVIGAVTAFFAATIAINQNDIKRVLAYSTLSQLGYMVMGMGVGSVAPAFFHLVTHAFFKAGLFLGSGSVIHASHHEQDMRYMGGLRSKMPVTFITFTICLFALSGLPLFTGFLSKDAILAGALGFAHVEGGAFLIVPILGFAAALLTPFYMGRQWFMVFFGENRASEKPVSAVDHHHGHEGEAHHGIHESGLVMTIPLVILAFLSFWFVFSPNPLSGDNGWFLSLIKTPETAVRVVPETEGLTSNTAFIARQSELEEAAHHAHGTAVIISISFALIGLLIAFMVYMKKINALETPFRLLSKMMTWFNETVMDGGFVYGLMNVGRSFSNFNGAFDRIFVDGLVSFVGAMVQVFGILLRKLQTGRIQAYVGLLLLAVVGCFVIFFRS